MKSKWDEIKEERIEDRKEGMKEGRISFKLISMLRTKGEKKGRRRIQISSFYTIRFFFSFFLFSQRRIFQLRGQYHSRILMILEIGKPRRMIPMVPL